MFRFRLQQVLNLRERQERDLALQLAHAISLQDTAREQLHTLQGTRAESAHVAPGTSRSVGELANLAFVIAQLDGYIANANNAVHAAEATVAHTQDALHSAFQDRRVLDRLRERHQEDHRAATEQMDRRTMDDIALTRFTQNDTP